MTTYFLLLILTSLRHFVAGQDFCFCCRSRYLFCQGRFIPFLCCQSFISFTSLLCFQYCVLRNLRQLMRLLINDLLVAVVIYDNRATRMCPSAMRLQAASAFIVCVSATYVRCCETHTFSFVHTHFIETLAKSPMHPTLLLLFV